MVVSWGKAADQILLAGEPVWPAVSDQVVVSVPFFPLISRAIFPSEDSPVCTDSGLGLASAITSMVAGWGAWRQNTRAPIAAKAIITGNSDLERRLTMDGYFFIDSGPIKEFLRVSGAHIDTAVAYRVAEIIVPISAVEGKAGSGRNP